MATSSSGKYPYPVKTVVVLVQENRSFDHMLGWMKSINPEIDGVTGEESNPLDASDPNSKRIYFGNDSVYVDPDPGHAIQDVYEQVYGEPWSEESAAKKQSPTMQGFVQNGIRKKEGMDEVVMNGFKPELVPVYKELASQFVVCDRWFSSVPSSTQPNRMFVHSATSHGLTSTDTDKLKEGLPQKTIFESLHESGYTFGIYYQFLPSTLFYRNLRKLKYLRHFHPFLEFKRHCEEGKLPNYVVVEQRFYDLPLFPANDDHPSHDISNGQRFVKEVYEALRGSPQWNEMLFIVIYDEHGGFYDHVPTPVDGVPSPDGIVGPAPYNFKFDRLGVRVPAILISPWIDPGTVLHKPTGPYPESEFEHSSIPATVKKLFNLNGFLTKRDAWAGTFETVLTRDAPRTDCPETSGSGSSTELPYPIKTVVVLVQENRSFDHMLGWMQSLNPEINGVTEGVHWNPLNTSDPNSKRIYFGDKSVFVDPDPGHSIQDIYEQVFGEPWSEESASEKKPPTMQGFAQNANRIKENMDETVMNGFVPGLVPVYKELASQFAVCDRWFASVPASTQPNRLFVHSATSHGLTSNDTQQLIEGLPQKTVFESLDEAGRSFGIYYQYPPATLFYRNLRKLKYLTHFHPFDLEFKAHCKEGKLPNYVVIEQRYFDLPLIPGNDDHPSHDVSVGQKFVKEIYEDLRSSPQWNEMLFIIIYDEHGGFYDHVPTPVDGVPSPDGIVGPEPYNFKFDRLGVRVPSIIISPWIEAGTVLHKPMGPYPESQFEHSSIPATVKKLFNLKDFLTKRDAWAGTFEVVLNRKTPRDDCPVTLPEPVKLREDGADGDKKLSDFQAELVQMAACLNGDHKKDTYPQMLVENMTVAEGAEYVNEAFNMFMDECEKAEKQGADESTIVVCDGRRAADIKTTQKSFLHKFFSCLVCDNN